MDSQYSDGIICFYYTPIKQQLKYKYDKSNG